MYAAFLTFHSLFRWLVLLSLCYAIIRAYRGYTSKLNFSFWDNKVRHWTATIAHIQLVIGITLYTQSPLVSYFWKNFNEAIKNLDAVFFGLLHMLLMLTAIVFITIGSALSKRKSNEKEKFKTMFVWFLMALIILFIAIPWPFSPLANRAYFR